MESRIKEQGSALHAVIITVLIVAVLGLLGFVFWQNFINKPSETISQDTADNVVLFENQKTATDQRNDTGLSLKYPGNWTIEAVTAASFKNGTKIVSPSGKFYVSLVTYKGLTNKPANYSKCNETPNTVIALDVDSIPGYPAAKLAVIVTHFQGEFIYNAGVYQNDGATQGINSLSVGEDRCGLDSSAEYIEMDSPWEDYFFSLSVFTNEDSNTKVTLSEVEDLINDPEYKVAKEIVRSLYAQ